VSDHEDVLRRFFADLGLRVAPWHQEAIDAVLAELESLRAERRSLSCSLSNVEDELKQAGMGCVGPTYLRVLKLRQRAERLEAELAEERGRANSRDRAWVAERGRAERLEKALRRMMVVDDVLQGFDAYAQIQSGKGGGMGGNILTEQQGRFFSRSYWERVRRALTEAREALAPSAPEEQR
jgi:hypothetical protein